MKKPRPLAGFLTILAVCATCTPYASALLPALDQPPWLGYFAVFANKHYLFGVTPQAKFMLQPMNRNNEPVGQQIMPRLDIVIEELLPDGKSVRKQINPDTLESPQAATRKLENAVIRGKVTGDAAFEVNIEQQRGAISIGGRVTDAGTLKNPLRFSLRVTFPNVYPKQERDDPKKEKLFEKKLKDDRIELKWTDGKRKKQTYDKPVDAGSKDLKGPGIAALQIETSAYNDKKLLFATSGDSAIRLSNDGKTALLYEGFTLDWEPDTGKDKDGKARLSIEVK